MNRAGIPVRKGGEDVTKSLFPSFTFTLMSTTSAVMISG